MWELEPTTQYECEVKYYQKKRPSELAAVIRNLGRYLAQLNVLKNPRQAMAGYLHHEPAGVVAIDQKGGGGNLEETRLYTFADDAKKIVYLITIGNKSSQPADIIFSRDFVISLQKSKSPTEP